jgi:vitamin B12 transporter
LSGMSIRGGGSAHTALEWNGLNLQSPMNSGVNLSVFPVFMIDNVIVQHGGSGSLYGSGAVSGIVHLNSGNLLNQGNFVSVGTGFGSFGNKLLKAKAKFGNDKFASSVKVYWQNADNDFKFRNTAKFQSPVENQLNAAYAQFGLLQENQVKISSKSAVTLNSWCQHYDKELQALMTDNNQSRARQTDNNLFLAANYSYTSGLYSLLLKSGLINNAVLYSDADQPLNNGNNASTSLISEAENKLILNSRNILSVGVNYSHETGSSSSYGRRVFRDRISLFSSFKKLLFQHLETVVNFRSEWVDKKTLPPVFSFAGSFSLEQGVTIRSTISKNYRIPSLNDLYWISGIYTEGNPNLKPESGWNSEIGISKKWGTGSAFVELTGTGFYNRIRNWILWIPGQTEKWRPENKDTGQSYGLESSLKQSVDLGKNRLIINTGYNWTHARLLNASDNQEEPLLYVPAHTAISSVAFVTKKYSASYSHKYCSKRYYDNSHLADSYNLGDISLSYNMLIGKMNMSTSLKVCNVWNAQYQVVAWYAMPGRNYMLTLNLKI